LKRSQMLIWGTSSANHSTDHLADVCPAASAFVDCTIDWVSGWVIWGKVFHRHLITV
jgi:hypothetical protein